MQKYSLEKVCDMSETERNKLTKAELLQAIKDYGYDYRSAKRQVKELSDQMSVNATNERAACVMLAAFNGVELEKDDYRGTVKSEKLNILELAGLTVAKCASIGR
jgi:hypothetical protein